MVRPRIFTPDLFVGCHQIVGTLRLGSCGCMCPRGLMELTLIMDPRSQTNPCFPAPVVSHARSLKIRPVEPDMYH